MDKVTKEELALKAASNWAKDYGALIARTSKEIGEALTNLAKAGIDS